MYYCSPIWIIIHTLTFYVPHSPQPYSRQQFLTSNILYSLLLYHLTRTVIKTTWFLSVEWSRHIINICVLALTTLQMATWKAGPCRWSLCNNSTLIKPKCICWSFNKIYTDLTISFVTWNPILNKQYTKNPTRHQHFTLLIITFAITHHIHILLMLP
jgi:hypothetical protein